MRLRVSVLDFSATGSLHIRTMFADLEFPRLKEVILSHEQHDDVHGTNDVQLSRYFSPHLETLRLDDNSEERNWLTADLLEDFAQTYPDLKELFLSVLVAPLLSPDLALFFRGIHLRKVCLELRASACYLITHDVLSALSGGGCLEVLVFGVKNCFWKAELIKTLELQRFCESTADAFSTLEELE